jgi:hypothetical protein
MQIQLSPITDTDLRRVADFLHRDMEPTVAGERWEAAIRIPWRVDAPNHGFMLLEGEEVVGVYLAYYSVQEVDGRRESFCNLGTWCVALQHRMHSLRLLRALLAQDGFHFTDFSPSEDVVALDAKLGFERLDGAAALVPSLPLPRLVGRVKISSDPARIEALLEGRDLTIYRDHAAAAGARHVAIEAGDRYCYVVLRKSRWKRLPVATLLYASDPGLLREQAGPLARHLFAHHRVIAYVGEDGVVGSPPRLSLRLRRHQPRMFRGQRLRQADIGYLYSELVCLSW